MTAELTGKLLVLTEDPVELAKALPVYPGGLIEELDPLPDGNVLVSGRWNRADPTAGVLGILNPATGQVEVSFFTPSVPGHLERGATQAGWTTSDVRGDTIATMFAFSDTIYLYGTAGQLYDKIPFNSAFVVAEVAPEDFEGPVGWMRHHSQALEIEWLEDGRFLIQYIGGTKDLPSTELETRYHTLLLARDGSALGEVVDGPRFHIVAGTGELIFQDPESIEPNRLIVANLR
ncbi:hypothetical protein [Gaopeijia maritima]|uniref:DUF4261 domain-containing protein n=1 Tax=Gaopeijia maritima TaxID=3119007 RepID=A0ABU9EDR4_9BACT